MMKRIVKSLFLFLFLLPVLTVTAHAQGIQGTFEANNATRIVASPGDELKIKVTFSADCASYMGEINYHKDGLLMTDMRFCNEMPGVFGRTDSLTRTGSDLEGMYLGGFDWVNTDCLSKSNTYDFMELTFKVLDTAAPGEYMILSSYYPEEVYYIANDGTYVHYDGDDAWFMADIIDCRVTVTEKTCAHSKKTYTAAKPSTCLEEGWAAYSTCNNCSQMFSASGAEISDIPYKGFADHTYGTLKAEQPATHSASGMKAHYICSVCNTYFTENKKATTRDALVIPMQPHDEVTVWSTNGTSHWHECSCGKIFDKANHAYGSWQQTKAPTCTEQGQEEHSCTCGHKETRMIAQLGHIFVNGTCTRCGNSDPDNIQPDVDGLQVARLSGNDRHETSFAIADKLKEVLKVDKFDTIVLASGLNFADALAGSYLAVQKDAPILLSSIAYYHQLNVDYIKNNLAPGGLVYILGGEKAVDPELAKLLDAEGIAYKRLAGADRFETNLMILEEANVTGTEILVSTGTDFADSLSASATGKPILLVNPLEKSKKLYDIQYAYLEKLKNEGKQLTFFVIGSSVAVPDALFDELKPYGDVKRLAGDSRELTSVEVAKEFFQSPGTVFLTNAWAFPDGLCGGPLAYRLNAPLLLVSSWQTAAAKEYVAANPVKQGYVLGGPTAVADASAATVFNLPDDYIIP